MSHTGKDTSAIYMIVFGKNYTSGELCEKAKELAELYPGHLYYQSAGETHDGREIPQLLLGDSPKCLILSLIHI